MSPPRFRATLAALFLTSPFFLGLRALADEPGSITGKLAPPHGHDFVLATVGIPDLALKTDVAADGSFSFGAVRPGSHLLEAHVPSLGYAVERVVVKPGEEVSIEIVLQPGSHFEEVIVTAAADARDPLELASPTTSLSGQELALRLQSSLGETLAGVPGVSSTFFGPGASRPIIRGLAGDRVRVLEGGIGTGDASGVSADHAVTADPGQAERIEVIRGPATLLYGSSAVGGVVNVIDRRIPSSRATGSVHGSVELRVGSGSDERTGSVSLDGGSGNWAWHVDALAREAGDYEVPGFARLEGKEHGEDDHGEDEREEDDTPFGFVPNTDLESEGRRAGVSYFLGDKGFLGLSLSGFDSNYGIPGGGHGHAEHGEEHAADEHDDGDEHQEGVPVRIDMEQRRVDLRGQLNRPFSGFEALKLRVGGTDYEHVELEGEEEGTFFFNESTEARLELVQSRRELTGGRAWGGSLGLQYFDRELEAVGAEAFLPKNATGRWALFTLQELEAGAVRWQLGARFESQDVDAATAFSSESHDGVSASLGLVWAASDAFSLAASAARSVKLPAAEELYSDGLHVATQAFEIGNPDLDEEVGLGLDLSLRLTTERVSGELTFFRQDFDDFIFQAFTGDEEDGFPVVLYSQSEAELQGAELKARIELWEAGGHHLHLELAGDVVEAELDAGGNLPRIPPLRLGGGLHYHSERWSASAEARWVDDQTDVAANETPTAGYTLVNASLGHRFLFRNQIVDVLLRGRNLTDEEARSHTSFLKDSAPLSGRDVGLAVKLLF